MWRLSGHWCAIQRTVISLQLRIALQDGLVPRSYGDVKVARTVLLGKVVRDNVIREERKAVRHVDLGWWLAIKSLGETT